jgi:DNA polymerase-3 subunit epsilon
VATCPCAGTVTREEYAGIVALVVAGLTDDPSVLLAPLAARMAALAEAERYEEAADMRDRAAALARALARQRQIDALRRAGRLEIEVAGEPGGPLDASRRLVLTAGRLPRRGATGTPGQLVLATPDPEDDAASDPEQPLPRHLVDELSCVASWLEAEARRVRLVHCEGRWAMPVPRLPRFEPVRGRPAAATAQGA